MPPGQTLYRLHQRLLVGAWLPAIAERRTRPAQHLAGSPLRDVVGPTQVVGGGTLLRGGHHFFLATSWSICLSSISSAMSRLRRSTSAWSVSARRASSATVGW